MADRAKKISELDALTAPVAADLLVIVDDVSGTAATKKVTVGNLFSNMASNVTFSNTTYVSANSFAIRRKATPVTSSGTSDPQGSIFYDDSYLYVATANGTLKRVALSSF